MCLVLSMIAIRAPFRDFRRGAMDLVSISISAAGSTIVIVRLSLDACLSVTFSPHDAAIASMDVFLDRQAAVLRSLRGREHYSCTTRRPRAQNERTFA